VDLINRTKKQKKAGVQQSYVLPAFDSARRFWSTLYYTSPVCVSDVLFSLAVWRLSTTKKITKKNIKIKIIPIVGVSSNQVLPGYLITAPPSVCVPDVIGALACGFQTTKKKKECLRAFLLHLARIAGVPSSQVLPGFLITAPPSVCVSDVIGALTCGFPTPKKKQAR